jgi:hypothetical protein
MLQLQSMGNLWLSIEMNEAQTTAACYFKILSLQYELKILISIPTEYNLKNMFQSSRILPSHCLKKHTGIFLTATCHPSQ